jgi:hypothetical protein
MFAAIAERAWALVVAGPRQRGVPPFAGDRVRPGEDPAVDDDAAADSGAEDDAEDHPCALRRAINRFAERKAICVIGQPHGPAERRGQVAVERPPDQARGIGVLHEAGGRRQHARYAQADAVSAPERRFGIFDQGFDGGDDADVVPRGRRQPTAAENRAVHAQRRRLDLGAPDINPKTHHPCRILL